MDYPHNYKDTGETVWYHRIHSKSNQYCPYCGMYLGDETVPSNKEHLIGNKFIPKIAHDKKSFNLIFRVCTACNTEKSNLERHISTVTLFNSPACLENSDLKELAAHKAKQDHHHLTGLKVDKAQQKFRIKVGASINCDFKVPPQIDPLYCKKLAFYHIQGFFTLITSSNPESIDGGTRILPFDKFYYFANYIYKDWGNPQLLEVEKRVRDWPCVAHIYAANGFFQAMIKKSYEDNWFWALEWNKYLRVVGGLTDSTEVPRIFSNLPPECRYDVVFQDGSRGSIKEEIPLPPDEDRLFVPTTWYVPAP